MLLRRSCCVLVSVMTLAGCGGGGSDEPTSQPTETALEGRLLFSRFNESTHTFLSTHVANADGSDEVEVTMPGPEGGGQWSHSGEEIAVMTVVPDGRIGTAIIDAEGEVLRIFELPDDSINLVCTVWSPDDSRLACEAWDESNPSRTGIYTVRSNDGSDLVRLTKAPANMFDLPGDYSPDGSSFLFKRTTEEDDAPLMVVSTAGGKPTQVSDEPYGDPGRYSVDGETILTSAEGELVLLDSQGVETGRIVTEGHFLFGPVWSPDGTHIAYSDAFGGPFADIYVCLPDGSDRKQITDTEDNEMRLEWGAPTS
ncbi:MAG TPA: hypothetical protein VLI04_17680 [Nocardioidaceae bacterium]|nr:hypothetical protein [Nocardioidaceae bacterium]